jgi:WD40 repeat protein
MPPNNAGSHEDRLHTVIAEYLQADEAGRAPDRTDLLGRNPDLAEGLREFFATHDRVRQAVASLHPPTITPRADPGATIAAGEPTSPAQALAPGMRFGDYELLQEIARGGMGVVYRARQVSLNRVVALKMIIAGQFASPGDVQRFRAEAEAAAALDHASIVPIYEVGQHHGQHFFSMKLIEGGSLAEEISRNDARMATINNGPNDLSLRSWRLCAQLLASVARAVHYAHQRGILHRDLKPANILLDRDGQPHVTDFGLAKRVQGGSDVTRSGAVVGTPSYMAPEQAQGKRGLSTAADVYSLGAILYELLTGRAPFRADTPLDTLLEVLDQEPERPRKLNPALDADLETICLKCLEKDPPRRYGSAEELAQDLERWLGGETIKARPSTRWERTVKWARRRPAVSALIAVSALSLVALLALAGFLWRNAELRAEAVQDLEKARAARAEVERERKQAKAEADLQRAAAGHARAEVGRLRMAADKERKKVQKATAAASAADDRARRTVYAADMQLAHAAWHTGNIPRLLGLLERHCKALKDRDARGFEWNYLHRLAHGDRLTLRWRPNPLKKGKADSPDNFPTLALSHDGKTLATVSANTPIQLWDRVTGKKLRTLAAPTGYVVGLTFAKGDKELVLVVTRPQGKELPPLDYKWLTVVAEGKEQPSLRSLPEALAVQRLPVDGGPATAPQPLDPARLPAPISFFRAGEQGSMGPMMKASFPIKGAFLSPTALALSPDRRTLAIAAVYTPYPFRSAGGQAGAVVLWDLTGKRAPTVLQGHGTVVTCVVFSPNGKYLVSGSLDKTIRLRETAPGADPANGFVTFGEPKVAAFGGLVLGVAFSPDSKQLAVACADGMAGVLGIEKWKESNGLRGHLEGLSAVVFTPDGKELATGSGDGTVKFWEPMRWQEAATYTNHGGALRGLTFGPDGSTLAAIDRGGTFRVCDALTLKERATAPLQLKTRRVTCAALTPDGSALAVGGVNDTVELLRKGKGKDPTILKAPPGVIHALAFSADGKILAAGGGAFAEGAVRLWDMATLNELHTLGGFGCEVTALSFSPNGNLLAAAGTNGTVKLWQTRTGKELFSTRKQVDVPCLAFSADGRRLAWASGDTVTIAAVPEGKVLHTIAGYAHSPTLLVFSPDGRRLASAGGGAMTGRDLSVKLWDPETEQEVLSLSGSSDTITGLVFSPDGTRLAAAFAEDAILNPLRQVAAQVRVWDARPIQGK